MSLDTWKAEFYPVRADAVPQEQALEHSLQKWRGLRPKAIARHNLNVTHSAGRLCSDENDTLPITVTTCALCQHYHDGGSCRQCPLYCTLGGHRCDADFVNYHGPYAHWRRTGDPDPMIQALELACARQTQK